MNWASYADIVNYTMVVALATFLSGLMLGWWYGFVRSTGVRRVGARPRHDGKGGRTVLYVGNLAYRVREGDLRRLFTKSGRVNSARIIRNRFNGESKGYGFVEMSSKSSAHRAINQLNGKSIRGRPIVVSEAKSSPK